MNIDFQLVEGAKKGDSECFSQLYELVHDDLYFHTAGGRRFQRMDF